MSIENPTFENQSKVSPEDVVKKIKEEAERERASVTSKRAAEKILEEDRARQPEERKVTFDEYGRIEEVDGQEPIVGKGLSEMEQMQAEVPDDIIKGESPIERIRRKLGIRKL